MLAEQVEVVIGVDTHKHSHTAAVVTAATGAVLAQLTVTTDPPGYQQLVELGEQHGTLRAWAMEGSGGYGAGLAAHLAERDELVIELDRPARPARRAGAKSWSQNLWRRPSECCSRPWGSSAGERRETA